MYFQAFGIILAVSCEKAASEAKYTSRISYNILRSFSTELFPAHNNVVKEELLLLAEHIRARNIHFSALFFSVDYRMLFKIFGSIATYLVIIIPLR